ncbi:hypothetical protein TNIN_7231, partial [Trichonephila inaurata madagascariensis]
PPSDRIRHTWRLSVLGNPRGPLSGGKRFGGPRDPGPQQSRENFPQTQPQREVGYDGDFRFFFAAAAKASFLSSNGIVRL